MSCHVMSCHVMSCHVMSCHVMSCHVMSCHVMSCHVMSCHVMSCHVMSCHVMSCHVMSCHVMSCHVMSVCLYVIIYIYIHYIHGSRSKGPCKEFYLRKPCMLCWRPSRKFFRVRQSNIVFAKVSRKLDFMIANIGSAKNKHGVRESFAKVTFLFAKNGRSWMKEF